MNDERIISALSQELMWDHRVNHEDIQIEVNDGQVNLKGTVPNLRIKQAVEEDAWAIAGVKFVNNNLTVNHPNVTPPLGGQEFDDLVKNALKADAMLTNEENLDIASSEGVVELEGSVDAYWKKDYTEDLVSRVTGVIDVRNNLSIVPGNDVEDKEIADAITSQLERSLGEDFDDIDIVVENGIVSLEGDVNSWNQKKAVTRAAKLTEGVKEIQDRLVII